MTMSWWWVWVTAIVAAFGITFIVLATRWPPIHDITTDLDDPPAFAAVLPYRTGRVSPAEYDGAATAAQQRRAYPAVRSLRVRASPADTFAAAVATARDAGWQIVAEDRAAGRIEAIATTRMLRFKDDVVIRIRPQEDGARVDVRSKSRVGVGDLGTNARRITAFLSALRARLS
jgi:uncharacterized protein (DUF1499 family)